MQDAEAGPLGRELVWRFLTKSALPVDLRVGSFPQSLFGNIPFLEAMRRRIVIGM